MTNNKSISKLINLSTNISIFSEIIQYGYTYSRRTRALIKTDVSFYYNSLIEKGVIKSRKLTKSERLNLLCQNGLSKYNVSKIKAYCFTDKYKDIFNTTKIKDYILNKLTLIQEDKIKRFLKNCSKKLKTVKLKHNIKKQLSKVNIAEFSRKCRVFANWSHFKVNTLYDFMQVKIRKICEYTGLNKEGLERIELRICELLDMNVNQVRTLITTVRKTKKFENLNK